MELSTAADKLDRQLANAKRELREAGEKEVRARGNLEKYQRRGEEWRRRVRYLQDRRKDLTSVETALAGER